VFDLLTLPILVWYEHGMDNNVFNLNTNRTDRFGLTERQSKALLFIRQYIADTNGTSPSYREIADHLEVDHVSSAHGIVEGLVKRGFLRRLPRVSRSVAVVD
jgi:SOS-response transcriptional repressor LexA